MFFIYELSNKILLKSLFQCLSKIVKLAWRSKSVEKKKEFKELMWILYKLFCFNQASEIIGVLKKNNFVPF